MNLLLTVFLACTLFYGAESLNCRVCSNIDCSSTTSELCPATSPICKTDTLVSSAPSVTVNKSCSSLQDCSTPLGIETEWSSNLGYARVAHTQICCITDDCNFQTLATPSTRANGKQCRACASPTESLTGNCNTTLSCLGVEDACFNATITINSIQVTQPGCTSRNVCLQPTIFSFLNNVNYTITCGAPWSVSASAALLIIAVTAHKILV